MIVFSVEFIDFLVTNECNHYFRSLLPSAIQSQGFGFSPFGGWQGDSGPWVGLPEWECKTDRYSSLVAHLHGAAREGECSTNSLICTPPPPDQGMLNRYFPAQEMPRHWRACACPSNPLWWFGVGCVVSWARTLRHRDGNTPRKTKKYITCRTSPTRATPKKTRRVHPERGKKQKKPNNYWPKDGRERGEPYVKKHRPQGIVVGKNA